MKQTVLWVGLASLLQAQSVLTTFAGTDWVFPGDGKPALNAPIGDLSGITLDPDGNPVIVVNNDCMVGRVQADGKFKVLAGNGFCLLTFLNSGEGGPATSAGIFSPRAAAFDAQGNLYILTGSNVNKVTPAGIITRIAGAAGVGGGYGGDDGPATLAKIAPSNGIAVDAAGNVYIGDSGNHRIRKVGLDGIITTIAGTGTAGFAGNDGPAINAQVSSPNYLAVDGAGNLYFAESGHIRKIDKNGRITSLTNYGVDGLAVDSGGTLYYNRGNAVFKLAPGATADTLIAGDANNKGFLGDGGPALSARFQGQLYLAVDRSGNVFVGDRGNARVRKISNGIVTTIAGNGNYRYSGEGVLALTAPLGLPYGMAIDKEGSVYFSERNGYRVRKVKDGILTTFAGNGTVGFSGDGGPATQATINSPQGLAFDAAGNLYIADRDNGRIRKISPFGLITTFASGIGNPIALAFDASGNLLVARSSCCVERIDPTGKVTRFAGTGTAGNSGDGGPAVSAQIANPTGIEVDRAGNVYVSDINNGLIRKIDAQGIISTHIASGLGSPSALRFDAAGNLFVADHFGRVRKVTPAGAVSIVAGGGPSDQLGDGKIATAASIPVVNEMAFDAAGNLYIADEYNYRVRVIPAATPSMQAFPSNVSFSAPSGGAPLSKSVTVTGSLAGLDFAVAIDIPGSTKWLTADATTGSTPRVLSLTADPTNLAPGSYSATLTITPTAATPAKLSVSVTFDVGPAQPPQLATDQPNLSFTFPRGTAATSANLRVLNTGGGTINFTASAPASSGGSFLAISPASGKLTPGKPVALTVTANPGSLAAGTYTATISIQGDAGGTVVIPVVMTISRLTQALRLTQTGISFTAVAKGGVVPSQTFGVVNVGTGVVNWTASTSTLAGGPNWLQISPRSGASNAATAAPQVTVSVDASGLAAGNYYGLVRIVAPGAANSPQVVTIFLEVLPAGSDPGAMLQPQELVFNATPGLTPGSQTLLVYSIGAGAKTFTVGRPPGFGVLVLPHEGALDPNQPSPVVIQPSGTFPVGTSTQVLNFQFSDGRVQSVKLTVIATPAAASANQFEGGTDARAAGGCTPTRLVPAMTSLGTAFAVNAGWPVAITAKVTDDCFNPLVAGDVTVSFSNGDIPVPLRSLNDGTWQATWTSTHGGGGNVVLRLDAIDPKLNISGSREVDGSLKSDKDPPAFTKGSLGSAAYPVPFQPIAPGGFVSIFGSRLADGLEQAKSVPLPETLGNTVVFIAGQIAPLHIVSEGQINFLVPYGINTETPQQIQIQRGLTLSPPVTVDVAAAQPGIFLSGGVNAIVVAARSDGTQFLVSSSAPAQAGDTLVIYCTGLGPTDVNVTAGSPAPLDRLANTVSPVTVTIGDKTVSAGFAGLTPGSTGLYQVNVVVPAGVSGGAVPITLTVAGQTSRPAPVAIR